MDLAMEGRTERIVRIETPHGSIEGRLLISQLVRTLDDLNMAVKAFLTVHSPVLDGTGWSFPDSPLSVNKNNILFLAELSSPDTGQSEKFVDFTRARFGSGSARSTSRGSFTCLPAAIRCCVSTRTPIRSSH